MRCADIKPGDYVRIRQWDDMEAEFGLDTHGSIACPLVFVEEMKNLCGMVFLVKTKPQDEHRAVTLEDGPFWNISPAMLEPACGEEEEWEETIDLPHDPARLFTDLFM